MTHSSTLYEKEVGAGLDVNSEKKKTTTVRPFLLPKASHIKHQIETTTTKKQYCGRVLLGRLLDGRTAGFNPQTQQMRPTCTA